MELPKIIARDFNPKKDLPNPTFKIKASGLEVTVFLSSLRTQFRKYLNTVSADEVKNQTPLDTIVFFLAKMNIEMSTKQTEKLIMCFKTDISRKINNQPFGLINTLTNKK